MTNQNLNLKKLLVIEDTPRHLDDVIQAIELVRSDGAFNDVQYAQTYDSAMELLKNNKYDGILSDIFFPKYDGQPEKPYGKDIAQYALEHNTPVVLITDTHHHGEKTSPICDWAQIRKITCVDAKPTTNDGAFDLQGRASSKYWFFGLSHLAELCENYTTGNAIITPAGIKTGVMHSVYGNEAVETNRVDNYFKQDNIRPSIDDERARRRV